MKKILLGTSALAVASLFAGVAGAAEAPKMTISGGLDYHIRMLSGDYLNGGVKTSIPKAGSVDIDTQQYMSELNFRGQGKTDGGLTYAAEIQVRPINTTTDEAHLTFGTGFGTVVLGDEDGPFANEIYGFSILPIGGQDAGQWANGNDQFGGGTAGDTNTVGETSDASKIVYKTPNMGGLQAVLAYTPNSASGFGNRNAVGAGYKDVIEAGVNFSGEFGGVGVGAHAAYGTGAANLAANAATTEDATFAQVGLKASMSGFTVAVGHGMRGEGGCATTTTGCDNGSFTDVGVAYSMDAISVGLGYFMGTADASSTSSSDVNAISLEVGYGIAEGLNAYAGVHQSKATNTVSGVDTSASSTSFVVGTRIAF